MSYLIYSWSLIHILLIYSINVPLVVEAVKEIVINAWIILIVHKNTAEMSLR